MADRSEYQADEVADDPRYGESGYSVMPHPRSREREAFAAIPAPRRSSEWFD
ncbi:MAG: hypothetical protein JOZ47_02110 [Kutzneria sp.]|nr:hypothetical protein [Kutzneria sp.]